MNDPNPRPLPPETRRWALHDQRDRDLREAAVAAAASRDFAHVPRRALSVLVAALRPEDELPPGAWRALGVDHVTRAAFLVEVHRRAIRLARERNRLGTTGRWDPRPECRPWDALSAAERLDRGAAVLDAHRIPDAAVTDGVARAAARRARAEYEHPSDVAAVIAPFLPAGAEGQP